VGELPIDLQSKLLRAIQEKEIRPVGGTRAIPVNVRILAATNRDLESAVQQGTFRRDLFFRLNVLTLRIPPLRERKQDIPLLAGHVLERVARTTGVHRTISDEALRRMLDYEWPGNVRELENCLERACALSSSATLQMGDLPTALRNLGNEIYPTLDLTQSRGILPLAEMEKRAIIKAIEQLHGDKLEAARRLGIGKTTLYRKLKEYGAMR
jgi:DNA-binding NtrC family response regulator